MRQHEHWWCAFRIPRWRRVILFSSAATGDVFGDVCPTCGVER